MSLYAILALSIGVTLIVVGSRKQRNRRVGLPPPSDKCKRNQPGAVP